jgi:acetyltransferase
LHPLDAIFAPRSIAVIGASEDPGSVGRTLMANLLQGAMADRVYPVNPRHSRVLETKAYPRIADVPHPIDLAVIATPAPTVPQIVGECAEAGVGGAIIISAGFRECGPQGAELEKQILAQARRTRMRLIGPNCLGVMNPLSGLNATFAAAMAREGNVAFLSQSGALCTAILDWSLHELVGFSAFVSTGSMLDIGWGDLIDYFASDPRTHSILIYMESVGDARAFLSAAREAALSKPIIVLKAGRTEAAAKAAVSHTGALTGSDEVFDAACRRIGVLRVNRIADLFSMAETLARQPRPKGPKLTIVTNAGGPAVLAADALIGAGGELAQLSPQTSAQLNDLLPLHWSHANPIDILGDAAPQRFADAVRLAAVDPQSDGLLVILTPQDMTDPTLTAQCLAPYAKLDGKPILASWMGGATVAEGIAALNRAAIPTFAYPDTAALAFNYMWRYSYNLRGIYQTPTAGPQPAPDAAAAARQIINDALRQDRQLLNEAESKQLLQAYDIPTVRTKPAKTPEQAIALAQSIGYPVVLKLLSKSVSHKSDLGGVALNLSGPEAVRRAFEDIRDATSAKAGPAAFDGVTVQPMVRLSGGFELILGSSIDAQFGPLLLFGAGGQLVEIFKDRALALPPLNATLARRLMEQTKIYRALGGARGRAPVDLGALEQLLVRFSRLVVDQPRIREIDINPLFASGEQILALDARVVLFGNDRADADLPRTAIRPYPSQYSWPWTMKDGTAVSIRPIRAEDEPLLVRFHQGLSDQTVRQRYLHVMKSSFRVSHGRLTRICFVDYDREIALVAQGRASDESDPQILAIARLTRSAGTDGAEFGLMVTDRAQNQGVGTELLRRLLQVAKAEHIACVSAEILGSNTHMRHLCEKLGFAVRTGTEEETVKMDLGIT